MKNTTATNRTALIAVLLIGSSAWLCAQYNPGQPGQPADRTTRIEQKATNMTAAGQSQIMKANKASSLIGSTVKNQQGDKLGKIHDVVLDYNSDRVAYVVLATDSGILQSEKLHAVPLRAFQCAADGSSVILNADKDKLTRSEGFDKNNWPSLGTTAWGAEPFWRDNQGAQGVQSTTPGLPATPDTQNKQDIQPPTGLKNPTETEPKKQP